MTKIDDCYLDADEGVLALGLRGAWVSMRNLTNRECDPEFDIIQRDAAQYLLDELNSISIQADSVLQGYRSVHDAIGFSNRTNMASPENLLGILQRTGRLTHINLLVDIYNLVSVETRLAWGPTMFSI